MVVEPKSRPGVKVFRRISIKIKAIKKQIDVTKCWSDPTIFTTVILSIMTDLILSTISRNNSIPFLPLRQLDRPIHHCLSAVGNYLESSQ